MLPIEAKVKDIQGNELKGFLQKALKEVENLLNWQSILDNVTKSLSTHSTDMVILFSKKV